MGNNFLFFNKKKSTLVLQDSELNQTAAVERHNTDQQSHPYLLTQIDKCVKKNENPTLNSGSGYNITFTNGAGDTADISFDSTGKLKISKQDAIEGEAKIEFPLGGEIKIVSGNAVTIRNPESDSEVSVNDGGVGIKSGIVDVRSGFFVVNNAEVITEDRKGSQSEYGIVQVDGTTITANNGVISAVGGGGSVPANVYTQDNLVAGKDISITQVAQPLIDSNTLHLCHFNDSVADVISGQSDWPSTNLVYLTGKFDKARGFNSTTFTKAAPQINFNQDTTVDFWLAPLTGSGNVAELSRINSSSSSTGAYFLKFYNPNGSTPKIQIGADFSGTGSDVDIQWPNTTFSWGSFFHVVFEKDVTNSVVYLFVNGKKAYEHAHTSSIGNVTLYGRTNGTNTDGTAFDEFRISNVVRWYTDFTPFSVPYSTTAGTTQYQINNTQPSLYSYTGFDASKTQVLKNVNGTLTWVDEA